MSVLKYSKRIVSIHWLTAILISVIIGTGLNMEHSAPTVQKLLLYKIHFSCGFMVFLLTIWRLFAFFRDPRPENLHPAGTFKHKLLKGVHIGLYAVILWMCISGMVSVPLEGILPALESGNPAQLPDMRNVGPVMISHHLVAKLVFLLIALHLGGALLYFVKSKQNPLKRIWY